MSYEPSICSLTFVHKHPNADRLQVAQAAGNQVIVGLNVKNGDVGVYFPPDGQLSPEFAAAHKLTKELGGYLENNRRVRAIRLRGQESCGIWLSLDCLVGLNSERRADMMNPNSEVWRLFVTKYATPATIRAKLGSANNQRARTETKFFRKHFNTSALTANTGHIYPPDAAIYITEKLHGTSMRFGYVLEIEPLSLWRRIWNRWVWYVPGVPRFQSRRAYRYLNGTRNTILADTNRSYRGNIVNNLRSLHEGEIIYGEIVGFTEGGAPIQRGFTYGCKPRQCQLYVYRITQTNEAGITTELSWNQVQARCVELAISPVPTLYVGSLANMEQVLACATSLAGGVTTTGGLNMREGVVVRIESSEGTCWFKHKSFAFLEAEGKIKDADSYVDVEEVA